MSPPTSSTPDEGHPQQTAEEDTQLQQIESLLVERLMNPFPSSRPEPPLEPAQPITAQHLPKRKRHRERKKRPRSDDRIKSFRETVARKARAAEQAALAIATVRPLVKSSPPPSTKPQSQTSTTSVPIIKVKQLPSAPPSKRSKSTSTQNASEQPVVDAANFVDAHRSEIGDFGSQALHRRDRKKYQMAKLIKLGCRPPKNQKMPIGLLQKRRNREKLNAQKRKQRDLATGMLLRTKRR